MIRLAYTSLALVGIVHVVTMLAVNAPAWALPCLGFVCAHFLIRRVETAVKRRVVACVDHVRFVSQAVRQLKNAEKAHAE